MPTCRHERHLRLGHRAGEFTRRCGDAKRDERQHCSQHDVPPAQTAFASAFEQDEIHPSGARPIGKLTFERPIAESTDTLVDLAAQPRHLALRYADQCPSLEPTMLTMFGAATLINLELHEPLDDVPEEVSDDIILRPLLDELGTCDTGLGHGGGASCGSSCAKKPSPRATTAALYATRGTPSYSTRGDTIFARSQTLS